MYRVLIVDDEQEIRYGLRLKVDWESLRLEVAGEASNGMEALERLANEAIDIVITDMNMPVMHGVSLLEACHEQHPHVRLIVITGYEEFSYAKAAVKHQARDYLLKPVSRDELAAALGKVARELEQERKHRDEQATVQWRLSQYYKEMKEHFILHLVREEVKRESDVQERAKLFQLDAWADNRVRFMTAGLRERSGRMSAGERTPDKLRLPFEMICREFAETYLPDPPHAFRDTNYPGLMHFIVPDGNNAAETFAGALRACIAEQLAFVPEAGIGQAVNGFKEWKEGYLSALLAWNLSDSSIRRKSKDSSDGGSVMTEDTAKLIRKYVARGELDAFERVLRQQLTEAFSESQGRFVKLVFQLYLLFDSTAHAAGIILDNADQLWVRPDMALGLDTVEKAGAFLARLARSIDHKSKSAAGDREQSLIKAAQQFIHENYMYELNLPMLAERFNYNPSYFSELFKAKVGKTFIHYLTDVRMKHAVRLLQETTLGLWDIAELTGFSNASYFSSKFKRTYGMTPSEYRQRPPEKIDNEVPKK